MFMPMLRSLFRVGTFALPIYSSRDDALFLPDHTPKRTPANAGCGSSVDRTAQGGLAKGSPERLVRFLCRPFTLVTVFCLLSLPIMAEAGQTINITRLG